jgi:hypothetical protein
MGSTIRWDIEHARPRRGGHLVRARGAKFRNSPLRMRLPPWKAGENSGGCFERSQQFLLPIGPWSLQGCCATRSPKSQFRRFFLDHKILCPGMVHHDRRSRLLRLQKKPTGQTHSNVLLRMKQSKKLRLILQIRASRIAKRLPRAPILLMKQIANVRRVLPTNPQLRPHNFMVKLR